MSYVNDDWESDLIRSRFDIGDVPDDIKKLLRARFEESLDMLAAGAISGTYKHEQTVSGGVLSGFTGFTHEPEFESTEPVNVRQFDWSHAPDPLADIERIANETRSRRGLDIGPEIDLVRSEHMTITEESWVSRSWMERLFSWPWRPFLKKKLIVTEKPNPNLYVIDPGRVPPGPRQGPLDLLARPKRAVVGHPKTIDLLLKSIKDAK